MAVGQRVEVAVGAAVRLGVRETVAVAVRAGVVAARTVPAGDGAGLFVPTGVWVGLGDGVLLAVWRGSVVVGVLRVADARRPVIGRPSTVGNGWWVAVAVGLAAPAEFGRAGNITGDDTAPAWFGVALGAGVVDGEAVTVTNG